MAPAGELRKILLGSTGDVFSSLEEARRSFHEKLAKWNRSCEEFIVEASDETRWTIDDFGVMTFGPYSPAASAVMALNHGLRDGYPLCCVEEFCLDQLACRHSALRRGSVPDGNGGCYVPCSVCCEAMGRIIAEASDAA